MEKDSQWIKCQDDWLASSDWISISVFNQLETLGYFTWTPIEAVCCDCDEACNCHYEPSYVAIKVHLDQFQQLKAAPESARLSCETLIHRLKAAVETADNGISDIEINVLEKENLIHQIDRFLLVQSKQQRSSGNSLHLAPGLEREKAMPILSSSYRRRV